MKDYKATENILPLGDEPIDVLIHVYIQFHACTARFIIHLTYLS